MNRILICLGIFAIACSSLHAQVEVLSNNPVGLHWKKIETENFRIIFPSSYEAGAQKMANTLEAIHAPEAKSLNALPKKIDIVLQNQNSISNGFVTIGPRHSEFFTSAPQNYTFLGSNDWMNLLAAHEYRHVVQYASSNTGITKFFKIAFGQYTQAALTNLATPNWFWEGDATLTETVFTKSGRGRIPDFNRTFRANLLEGKNYKYDKQYLGSYKDFVPNDYVLGYHFVSHVRRKADNNTIWADITGRAFSRAILPFAFSNSLKMYTGKNVKENYNEMLNELKELWSNQIEQLELTAFETINKRKNKVYTDYSNPMPLENGVILCLKSGVGSIQKFVTIHSDGKEEVIHTPGIMNNAGAFSLSGNSLVWNEFRYNPRYDNQSYSVIESLSLTTKENQQLTKKTRFHSASLSPDGKSILTVEAKEDGEYEIVVVNASSGEIVKRFGNEPNTIYNLPSWSDNGEAFVYTKINDQGKSVVIRNYETGIESVLIPATNENIGNVFLNGEYLFYHSAFSGIDNIYALHVASKKHYQVTNSKYGAYNAAVSPNHDYIYYNDHTLIGLDIVKVPFNPKNWRMRENVTIDRVDYYQPVVEQEENTTVFENIPNEQFKVDKYNQLKSLINPHSWGPLLTSNINEIEAGIISQNILSTTSLYAGVVYDAVEQTTYGVGRASYQGLWPIIDLEVSKGIRNTSEYSTWDESSMEVGLRIPLTLTRSKFRQRLTISDNIGIRKIGNYQLQGGGNMGRLVEDVVQIDTTSNGQVVGTSYNDIYRLSSSEVDNGEMVYNHLLFTYNALMKMSLKDIYPKLGLAINFETYNTLKGDFNGTISAFNSQVFLPGFFKHHSIHLVAAMQARKSHDNLNLYSFQNRIFRARGYSFYNDREASTLRVNYMLPLWHPDIALGPIVYIKRFKLNGFMDNGKSNVQIYEFKRSDASLFRAFNVDIDYRSFGAELTMDFNVIRLPYDLEIGVRVVYSTANLTSSAGTQIEFMVGNISF